MTSVGVCVCIGDVGRGFVCINDKVWDQEERSDRSVREEVFRSVSTPSNRSVKCSVWE